MNIQRLLFCGLCAALILSCSKPAAEQASSDSPVQTAVAQKKATLTPDEEARVKAEIYMALHRNYIDDMDNSDVEPGKSQAFAYQEEFRVAGNQVHYRLLRHNGAEAVALQEFDVTDDEYMNIVDTIVADFRYELYEYAPWEGTEKKVRVVPDGTILFVAYQRISEMYSEPRFEDSTNPVEEILVDLAQPLTFDREELYAKARIMDLSEQDLAGMNKDELGYLRNEIFARHGHTFKTDKMVNYFIKKSWYYPVVEDAAGMMNAFEKRNVDFIKKREG